MSGTRGVTLVLWATAPRRFLRPPSALPIPDMACGDFVVEEGVVGRKTGGW